MPIIKYTKWKGSKRIDPATTKEVSIKQAKNIIQDLLQKRFNYRFGKQNNNITTLNKFIKSVEHVFTIILL